jgi:hypothetical protein
LQLSERVEARDLRGVPSWPNRVDELVAGEALQLRRLALVQPAVQDRVRLHV